MKKILIVEDDQLVATAYKKRFREAGYEVEWAPDGLEAIKLVGVIEPTVVLLDLLMPRLDGIEVLKYIREHPDLKHLPVVVFSNSYMTNLVESAWRAGADQCLMKASTTPAQLFDAVNKAIQKAAARVAAAPVPSAHVGPVTPLARPAASPVSAPTSIPQALSQPTLPSTPAPAAPSVAPGSRIALQLETQPPFVMVGIPVNAPTPAVDAPPLPAPAPAPVAPSPAAPAAPAEVDPEFQAQIRQLFLGSAAAKLAAVSDAANAFVLDPGSSMQMPLLADLFCKVHSLTGNAAVAGCARIAHYTSTFEAFLQELQQKPQFINASTSRSVMMAVAFLEFLLQQTGEQDGPDGETSPVLVVDADATSCQAVAMALERAQLKAEVAFDPAQALALLASGAFSSVVVAVNLPGLNGFELCAQMQGLCPNTPFLFLTTLNDFNEHSNPEVLGENDVIAAPFLLIEMTLKAVTLVEWTRAQKAAARGSASAPGLAQAV
jgi:CheY-like chemotaxis protein/HPt (histidine-containing phosphotransfer) domain-containing protein